MTSIREQALADAFATIGAIAGYTVTRNRVVNFDQLTELPALNQIDGGHSSPSAFNSVDTHVLRFEVEIIVPGDEEVGAAALNAAYSELVQALTVDLTRGGVVHDTRETGMGDPEYYSQEEGLPAMTAASVTFECPYWTVEGNPEVIG